eukprot:Polyplicarium_translucidae@DN1504_c0_g1_i1.p2
MMRLAILGAFSLFVGTAMVYGPQHCPKGCQDWFDGCNSHDCFDGMPIPRPQCDDPQPYGCRKFKPCPPDCETWHDGCNLCQCTDSGISACTMVSCETPQGPGECRKWKTPFPEEGEDCHVGCSLWNDGCSDCYCDYDLKTKCERSFCFWRQTQFCKEYKWDKVMVATI